VDPSETNRVAEEMFLMAAAPALVRKVARLLAPFNIPVMPLKGALLQRLVYKTDSFRSISDVDLLVSPRHFAQAYAVLRGAGFSQCFEEPGLWEVALRRGDGLLAVDLHQKFSATTRSRLDPDDMFRRGTADVRLFDAAVILPDPRDLYAHLLLHLTMHFANEGTLHHAEDLEAVPAALGLRPELLADHLARLGLGPHAAVVLPMVDAQLHGAFTRRLLAELRLDGRARVAAGLAGALFDRFSGNRTARRWASFALSPSWVGAAREGLAQRRRRWRAPD
jgi:hypothetical protein